MPQLNDIHIRHFLESGGISSGDFSDWVKRDFSYQSSEDPVNLAIEKSYFSFERAKKEWIGELENIIKLESDLLPVLAHMEDYGVYVEQKELEELWKELQKRSKEIEAEMYAIVWEIFNPASPKQVQYILYEKLGITKGKKIKTGYSVDSEALEEIQEEYHIAELLLEYRGLEKLRSTYVEWLLKHIGQDGRIHTDYRQTWASTGRLSSVNPNLQNIPSGSWYPERIKAAFQPKEDEKCFVVADYSQVELRILAILSEDEELIRTFERGEDIHARTAHFLFGEWKEISSEERRIAKAVNFWVIYGISSFGLAKMMKISQKDAKMYIDTFFHRYPRVSLYYENLLKHARETGFVSTFFGRRRTIKWLHDANAMLRQWAEREAMNAPIQWTAADVIKFAMVQIFHRLEKELPSVRMLMQVHDELIFESLNTDKDQLCKLIKEVMESILPYDRIHLIVDIGSGENWSKAKK